MLVDGGGTVPLVSLDAGLGLVVGAACLDEDMHHFVGGIRVKLEGGDTSCQGFGEGLSTWHGDGVLCGKEHEAWLFWGVVIGVLSHEVGIQEGLWEGYGVDFIDEDDKAVVKGLIQGGDGGVEVGLG